MRFTNFTNGAKLIKTRLEKVREKLSALIEEAQLTKLQINKAKTHIEQAKLKYNEFKVALDKILEDPEVSDDFDLDIVSQIQDSVEELFYDILALGETLVPTPPTQPNATALTDDTASVTPTMRHSPNVRVPEIKLPTFSGEETEWSTFYNLFEHTVHRNSSLTNVEKMTYLLGCLTGDALSIIKSLNISDSNYLIALKALTDRYQNCRLLITAHVNKLIDFENFQNVNSKQLRNFVTMFSENLNALKALDVDLTLESTVLTTLTLRHFEPQLRKRFEGSRSDPKTMPNIKEFLKFLENECDQLEAAGVPNYSTKTVDHSINSKPFPGNNFYTTKKPFTNSKPVTMFSNSTEIICTFCKNPGHKIYKCVKFLDLDPKERFEYVKSKSYCTNCLGSEHKTLTCKSKNVCSVCNRKHHSLLHVAPTNVQNISAQTNSVATRTAYLADSNHIEVSQQEICNTISNSATTVLLGTALVSLTSPKGHHLVCRAVLDSAASSSFITTHVADYLRLNRTNLNLPQVCGLSTTQVKVKGLCHVNVAPVGGENLTSNHPVIVLDKLTTNLPRVPISSEVKALLKNYVLADPTFDVPSRIDVLLGADLFSRILLGGHVVLGENLPIAINTVFGFVVIGNAPTSSTSSTLTTLLCTHDLELHNSIQRFWLNEEPPLSKKLSKEEETCEKCFADSHYRDSTGRYVVRLPFKENTTSLGESSQSAFKQFVSLEKRLESQPLLKEKYVAFMTDYIESGHMQLCGTQTLNNSPHFYLPHHGVFKGDKLRVVFNASASTSSRFSLNDILHSGPKLQNSIFDIMFNFRRFGVVFSCDIKQMFRQINVDPLDRKYQLIYWREDPSHKLSTYELSTVTYGMSCSPYLANRVVQQLIEDESHAHPLLSSVLRDQIYVDDILLGSNTVEEAVELQNDLISLLSKGGFVLRKWTSSHDVLLSCIPSEHCETSIKFADYEFSESEPTSVYSLLGLKWLRNEDCFSYIIDLKPSQLTKRGVLSQIAKIYDVMGFLTPIVMWAKSLMQLIWTKGTTWDEPLPADIIEKWMLFLKHIPSVTNVRIPRHLPLANAVAIQLHGFCDASQVGYACCVYLRCTNTEQEKTTHLLMAKSRVAPLKQISLPRLELCGAYLLSKLLKYCYTQLSPYYDIEIIRAWCDSTITLAWIHTPSYRLKTYVANRVSEIQENIPPDVWRHIPSAHNPADCASRGLLPHQIINHSLWWHGPPWLLNPQEDWINADYKPPMPDVLPESKPLVDDALLTTENRNFLLLYSSWMKLLHITVYILRFLYNTRNLNKFSGPISQYELRHAEDTIYKLVQKECFSDEIVCLQKGTPCSTPIQKLAPFLDNNGIIRVGGRLKHADLPYTVKHPILLPKRHHVVTLLIDYYHVLYLHCGAQQLQSILGQKYWILSARNSMKTRVFKCLRCFRCRPKLLNPLMGDLPVGRVTPHRCFNISGTDFSGPYTIKLTTLRRLQPIKVYLCIFICFSTKAVHFELVMDLTSEAFVAALTRFVSRRGLISELHCDNATNFTGAARQLKRTINNLAKERNSQQFFETHSIKFKFIPPRSPHIGGLWERAIQSAKSHMQRVIGDQVLTLEEFSTLIVRVEAVLNSRPITPVSNDPNDLEALTPGHFITGGPLLSLSEIQLEDIPSNRLRRWQRVQSFAQQIWSRWRKEYLCCLQQRPKWFKQSPNLHIGDMVIIIEDNVPSLQWKLGRVVKLYPGQDNVVRVVDLKTANGIFKRPTVKLALLPIEPSNSEC